MRMHGRKLHRFESQFQGFSVRSILLVAGILLSACASSSETLRTAGDVFRDCRECPQKVAVAGGQFMMGDMYFGYEDHRPVHRISVQDFAISAAARLRGRLFKEKGQASHAIALPNHPRAAIYA